MEDEMTESRRKARAGLVAIRIGPRVYWVPTETARWVESISKQMAEHVASRPIVYTEAYDREKTADAGMELLDAPQTTNVTRMMRKE
jgi:hypothetical protein